MAHNTSTRYTSIDTNIMGFNEWGRGGEGGESAPSGSCDVIGSSAPTGGRSCTRGKCDVDAASFVLAFDEVDFL